MRIILFIFSYLFLFSQTISKEDPIVLMYHKFGENKYPSTSIKTATFISHLEYLKNQEFNVLPLSRLIDYFYSDSPLPRNSIFITIDDGYKSVFDVAFPLLKKYNFPFSVFISPETISSSRNSDFMSWSMLKTLSKNNVEINNHTIDHSNLIQIDINEIEEKIEQTNEIIFGKLNQKSKIFSYPYGESSNQVEEIVKGLGFKLAFGQQSGPLNKKLNRYRLPRFSINEKYGDIDRFKFITSLMALEVFDVVPDDTLINEDLNYLRFSTKHPIEKINCYHSNGIKLKKKMMVPNRVEIKFLEPLIKGRNRINCTYKDSKNNTYWFGKLLII